MKRFICILVAAALGSCPLFAALPDSVHRVEYTIDYTTEMQTNFRALNWVNQLHASMCVNATKWLAFKVGSLSAAQTHEESLIDEFQGFSNIEAGNIPFTLSQFGFQFNWHNGFVFTGVSNINEDYFTSPHTSLFTNSSCGVFPTLAANYDIANYPYASFGVHFEQRWERPREQQWGLQVSIYNGQGSSRIFSKEGQFRFAPKTDGVFAIVQGCYQWRDSEYFLGCSGHTKIGINFHAYIEQHLTDYLHLLVGAGYAPHFKGIDVPSCQYFVGCGLVADIRGSQLGVYFDHTEYESEFESACELTWQMPVLKICYIQPAIHLIASKEHFHAVGMFRFGISLGNG